MSRTVPAAPSGPTAPSGGWSVIFGDAFATPVGPASEGRDDLWQPRTGPSPNAPPGKDKELGYFSASQIAYDAGGLILQTVRQPNFEGSGWGWGAGALWSGLSARSDGLLGPDYRGFAHRQGVGITCAEIRCKLPHNTGEMDPAFWSDASGASVGGVENELDFFEVFGYGETFRTTGDERAAWPAIVNPFLGEHSVGGIQSAFGFDPEAGFHTYTFHMDASAGGGVTKIKVYADGVFKWELGLTYPSNRQTFTHLIITNELRSRTLDGAQALNFQTTGEKRPFLIDYIAMYAGPGAEWRGGGLAPGTEVSGSTAPTVTKPGPQESTVGIAITPLAISATNTTEYKATGLPAGLSINSATGIITGTPTTARPAETVTVTVKGAGGEVSTTFTWAAIEATGPRVGAYLKASTGVWRNTPTSFAYQWLRCDSAGANPVAITGATAIAYVAAGTDVGHMLRVAVTATNAQGSAEGISAATAIVKS